MKQQGEWCKPSEAFKQGHASPMGVVANKEKAQANENNKRAAAMVKLKREIAAELNLDGFKTSQGSSFQATQAMRLYKEVNP